MCAFRDQVHPHCGDGVEFSVVYTEGKTGATDTLHAAEYQPQAKPLRQRLHFFLDWIHTGDTIDFIAWPKENHDCDGTLILEAKIWDASEYHETTTY